MEARDDEISNDDIEPGCELEMPGSKFRFQNRFVLLTYKHHLDKDAFSKWIKTKVPSTTFVRLAHETGDPRVPYEHTHVVADFGGTFQTTNCRFFDYDGYKPIKKKVIEKGKLIKTIECGEPIHPNIKKLVGPKAFADAKVYISKEDPANEDLKKKPSWVEGALNCPTALDAVRKYAKRPGDVAGIVALKGIDAKTDYRIRTKNRQLTLRPWQKLLVDELENNEPIEGRVIWIYNVIGRCGKNTLGRYMRDNIKTTEGLDKYEFTQDLGTSYHAATILQGMLDRGWQQWGITINMPRTAENHDRIYDFIEVISDGEMTVQKWKGMPIKFDWPHVVVTANWPPKVIKFSTPRWDIRSIDKDENGEWMMTKVDAYELLKEQRIKDTDGFSSSVVAPKRQIIKKMKPVDTLECVGDELMKQLS